MLTEKFTLLDLTDLALKLPEVGHVNFNILHTVISNMIIKLGLDDVKVPCYIEDEVLAQAAVTKARIDGKVVRRPSTVLSVKEIKEKMKKKESRGETEEKGSALQVEEKMKKKESRGETEEKESAPEVEEKMKKKEGRGETKEKESAPEVEDLMKKEDREETEEGASAAQDQEKMEGGSEELSIEEEVRKIILSVLEKIVGEETGVAESSQKGVTEETIGQIKDASEEEEESAISEKDEEKVKEKDDVKKVKLDDDDKEDIEIIQDSEPETEESGEELDIEKLKDTARDLMEAGAEVMAEKAEAVADAFQTLRDEELLDTEDPAKVIQELWRSIHINRRMEGAEAGLSSLSEIIDDLLGKIQDLEEETQEVLESSRYMLKEIKTFVERMESLERTCDVLASRIDDSNEKREYEVERLEELINELKMKQENDESTINAMKQELEENVAYKSELDELKEEFAEDLDAKIKETRKLIREVEDTLVKKDDFQELIFRVEQLEEDKVSRHELGRLLEPGFIDNFLEEQKNLRIELEELKERVIHLESSLEELERMIEEEVIKVMHEKFAEVHSILDTINAKLALLDPDEINDSFANLEEQVEMILRDLGELKSSFEDFLKEAKNNFKKMVNLSDWLNRLEQTKMDKSKLYELLETKADLDLILGKLDRSEFAIVVGNMKDDIERLTLTVKMNEEIMNENFAQVRQELSLTMYKEDFIYCTEPIRNRIKALIYELKRVKEIALTHLFPDAPGITKCISCKRGAHLAGPKYTGGANTEFADDRPSESRVRIAYEKSPKPESGSNGIYGLSLPPIDLGSVPLPPPDKPREKDPGRLPILFATARPNIGLTHEVRKSTIDKRLAAYFAKKPVRPIGGEYTRTETHQRGVPFTSFELSLPENEEVLLKGIDEGIYRGSVPEGFSEEDSEEKDQPKPTIKTSKKSDIVIPTTVSLHVDNEPLQKSKSLPKASHRISFPSNQNNKKSRSRISK